jgi:hypothetical protein
MEDGGWNDTFVLFFFDVRVMDDVVVVVIIIIFRQVLLETHARVCSCASPSVLLFGGVYWTNTQILMINISITTKQSK